MQNTMESFSASASSSEAKCEPQSGRIHRLDEAVVNRIAAGEVSESASLHRTFNTHL